MENQSLGFKIGWYNKHFRFVFSPNVCEPVDFYLMMFGYNSKRFLVGAGALKNYIVEKNAVTVLKSIENMQTDKMTVKFRKCGKIEIYNK